MGSRMKQLLVVLVALVTVLLALTQLYDWITASSSDVVAEVRYGSLPYPPGLDAEFHAIRERFSQGELSKLAAIDNYVPETDEESRDLINRVLNDLSRELRFSIPDSLPRQYSRIEGFWQVRVVNSGTTQARAVKLAVPHAVIASVSREGAQTTMHEIAGIVDLGDLHPTESVTVIAWSTHTPARYDEDSLRLTHTDGIGELSIYGESGPFGRFIDRNWIMLVFVMLITVLLAFSTVMAILESWRRTASPTEEGDDPEERDA